MRHTLFILSLACSTLTACAGRQEVVTLAGQSSAVLNDYRREMTDFAARQNTLAQDSERRLAHLREIREETQANVDRSRLAWELAGDKVPLELLATLSSRGVDQILSGSEVLQGTAPSSVQAATVKFEPAQIEAIIKSMKALERSPTLWDKIAFAVAYDKALKEAYRASLKQAEEEALAAKE